MHLLLIIPIDPTGLELEKTISSKIKDQQKTITSSVDNRKSLQLLIKNENSRSAGESILSLHDNDRKILSFLQQEDNNCKSPRYTFNGLMRRLNMHQQSLARSLQRLQKLELVQKFDTGYGLIAKNRQESSRLTIPSDNLCNTKDAKRKGQIQYFQLLQTHIPISISDDELVRGLIGKWFNELRWAGLIENEETYCLQWTNSDNSFVVNFYMVSKYIMIETNAITNADKVEAMAGSYHIFEQIIKLTRQKLSSSFDVCTLDYMYEHLYRQDN